MKSADCPVCHQRIEENHWTQAWSLTGRMEYAICECGYMMIGEGTTVGDWPEDYLIKAGDNAP